MGIPSPRSRGFTLAELMMVLAVAAVILAIGVPAFGQFRDNNRLTAVANDFLASVQFARSEAGKRQQTLSLCASSAPTADDAECSDGPFLGWLVFVDANSDCVRQLVEEEPVLRAAGPFEAAGATHAKRLRASSNGTCIAYASTGFPAAPPGANTADRIVFCDQRGTATTGGSTQSAARGVVLSATGRAQVTRNAATIDGWAIPCQ